MKNNNKGFSLIELSIVLIIMGLLVAGITGGASLIKTAQLRSIVTESQSFIAGVNTYFGQYNKIPGEDPASVGKIKDSKTAWEDLKNAGITDKAPETDGIVRSKFKNGFWSLMNSTGGDFDGLNVLLLTNDKLEATLIKREALNILDKVDDGKGDSGSVRALSTVATYGGTGVDVDAAADTDKFALMFKLEF